MIDPRRGIPSVETLLQSELFDRLLSEQPRSVVVGALRGTLERLRDELASGRRAGAPDPEEIVAETRAVLQEMERPSLRRVINATGVPLHTNLGRAPLAEAAREALGRVAFGYSNLEYDLERGVRGSRHGHCAELLRALSGAEGALVVNNNAAAVVLALNELADGHEVIVSRGELVEIGGSFRVPEIIAKSGARLIEVGATNRTHAKDYEKAITPETRAILKVHQSNFRQSGFVSEVPIDELVAVAHRHALPVVHDLGSGMIPDAETAFGLPGEPNARLSLEVGADIVTFSADKLLGGPQAGVILGRGALIDRIRGNPLLRALRVGKLTLAGLEATLQLWRDEATARARIPALAMITAEEVAVRERAERLAHSLRSRAPSALIDVAREVTEVGGGSYPGVEFRTWVLRIAVPDRSEESLAAACRRGDPPVIGQVREGALCLDPRTVLAEEESQFIDVVVAALSGDGEFVD